MNARAWLPSRVDVRCGIRVLARSPGFTAVAVLTLALGIGPSSAVFGILNAVFLRPIPLVPNQDRLFVLGRTLDGRRLEGFSHPGYLEYRARAGAFDGLMAFRNADVNLGCRGEVRRASATLVTDNYFAVLGVTAARGRTFLPGEASTPGSSPVAVVSHRLWARCFAPDPTLDARTLILNRANFTVVGVAPEGFVGTELDESPDLWIPLTMEGQVRPLFPTLNDRFFSSLKVVGRLKPGVAVDQARAEMQVLSQALEDVDGATQRKRDVTLSPHVQFTDPEWRVDALRTLATMMAVAGLVFLVACANVANLLLARYSSRRKDIAVRCSLGARGNQALRQLLVESSLLALSGGTAGIFFGWAITSLARATLGSLDLTPDTRVVGFAFCLSLLTALVVGMAPALRHAGTDLVAALKDAATGRESRSSGMLRVLLIVQVALSMVSVVTAGLFIRTLDNSRRADLGFETGHVLVVPLDLRPQGYPDLQVQALQRRLVERLEALPGVRSVSLANDVPVSGFLGRTRDIQIDRQGAAPEKAALRVDEESVGARYFETVGVSIVRGRGFDDSDRTNATPVAVVSESMARRLWPGEDPTGKRLRISRFMSWSPDHVVVGVARDTRYHRLEQRVTPHLYVPLAQNPEVSVKALVRTDAAPASLIEPARRQVAELDASLPLPEVMVLAEHIRRSDSDRQLVATLAELVGFLSLVLASAGAYSLTSYAVSQRTREFGLRMALGAEPRHVVGPVVREALLLALAGVAIGLAGSLITANVFAGQLYGVGAVDPLVVSCASALLLLVIALAAYVPARRAIRVDPNVALRCE